MHAKQPACLVPVDQLTITEASCTLRALEATCLLGVGIATDYN
jgi:hypothetical protein